MIKKELLINIPAKISGIRTLYPNNDLTLSGELTRPHSPYCSSSPALSQPSERDITEERDPPVRTPSPSSCIRSPGLLPPVLDTSCSSQESRPLIPATPTSLNPEHSPTLSPSSKLRHSYSA